MTEAQPAIPHRSHATYTPPVVSGTGPTQYAYNLDWQLTAITRPDNLLLTVAYDSAGRQSGLTVPNGQYLYAYSATTGRLTGITAPGGPPPGSNPSVLDQIRPEKRRALESGTFRPTMGGH